MEYIVFRVAGPEKRWTFSNREKMEEELRPEGEFMIVEREPTIVDAYPLSYKIRSFLLIDKEGYELQIQAGGKIIPVVKNQECY